MWRSVAHPIVRTLTSTFVFLSHNPTRSCLFTSSICLLAFCTLSLLKLAEIARHISDAQGGICRGRAGGHLDQARAPDRAAGAERSLHRAAAACGASRAIRWAKVKPEAGVALKPP